MICLTCLLYGQGIYEFWGMTRAGGRDSSGTIFSINSKGEEFKIRHHFSRKATQPGAYYSVAFTNGIPFQMLTAYTYHLMKRMEKNRLAI
jgi:uncharacterized repeat protein (TIGR03803 family)